MTRRLLWHLFLTLIALAATFGLTAAAPPQQSEPDHYFYLPTVHGGEGSGNGTGDFAARVVDLVNRRRIDAGCPSLAVDARLTAAAQGHSEDMGINDFFSHTGSDGSLPWDRMEAEGYNWSRAAENIAAGYPTPEDVVAAWMRSTGHRDNILNCALVDTGVGYVYLADDGGSVNYRHYWTQLFGAPR